MSSRNHLASSTDAKSARLRAQCVEIEALEAEKARLLSEIDALKTALGQHLADEPAPTAPGQKRPGL